MNVLEVLAVFVGIPAVIYGLIAALTLLPGRSAERVRYRPGEPWDHAPQWWAGDTPVQIPSEAAAAGAKRGGARGSW
ncbi:MAG: hypothetical protein WKF57_19600 [Nakamurella sp.]